MKLSALGVAAFALAAACLWASAGARRVHAAIDRPERAAHVLAIGLARVEVGDAMDREIDERARELEAGDPMQRIPSPLPSVHLERPS
jgi:HAMP domain-containing protein